MSKASMHPEQGFRFRLLLVDDQPSNLHALGSLLSKDYDLVVATSGPQALKIAQGDQRPDLILLDVMMPEMDGHEVCRQLKANSATADIPVIFVTALDSDEDLQEGFTLGAVDYITKPLRPHVVHARVDNQIKLLAKALELEKAKDEVEASNRELEQFAYAVSHDLRQPLRMISSYLGLLKRSLKEGLNKDQQEFIDTAVKGASRLDGMILGLLNYSRVGRKGADFKKIDTRQCLDEALTYLHADIKANQAKVTIEGQWPELVSSHQELTRLFQNLIGNALKYVQANQTAQITVTSEIDQASWKVAIKDQGVGIPPDQKDRLFKVFSRLHTRDQYEGNGVGLALCRKIVEHHQGHLDVDSAGEGQGSTFWFRIPLQGEAHAD